jgi:hypothetical protein
MAEGAVGSFQPKVVALGLDEDGDPTRITIVSTVDSMRVPHKQQPALSKVAQIALRARRKRWQPKESHPPQKCPAKCQDCHCRAVA